MVRPDGSEGEYFVIPRPDCAKLVGLTEEGKFVMIGRWMYPTQEWSVEFAGGNLTDIGRGAEVALSEFFAETGYAAPDGVRPEYFASGHLLNGWFPSRWHAYLVRGVFKAEDATDRALKHGTQAILELSAEQIAEMIRSGEGGLTCSVDQALVAHLVLHGLVAR